MSRRPRWAGQDANGADPRHKVAQGTAPAWKAESGSFSPQVGARQEAAEAHLAGLTLRSLGRVDGQTVGCSPSSGPRSRLHVAAVQHRSQNPTAWEGGAQGCSICCQTERWRCCCSPWRH